MPAQKKSAKKQAASKKKASAKKPAAKKAPAKKISAKKAPAKKISAKKAPAKKISAKKAPAKKAAAEKQAAPEKVANAPKPEAKPAAARKSGVSSLQVMMGHVFTLRPRVSTGFKPDDFRRARQMLEEEGYESIEKAARAVAEKALDLTREVVSKNRREKRR